VTRKSNFPISKNVEIIDFLVFFFFKIKIKSIFVPKKYFFILKKLDPYEIILTPDIINLTPVLNLTPGVINLTPVLNLTPDVINLTPD
jgi:hypothetical protein